MKGASKRFVLYLTLTMVAIFSITILKEFYFDAFSNFDYLMYGMFFIVVIISGATSLVTGLFFSAFVVIVYGSYILYSKIMGYYVANTVYLWIISIPLIAFLSGHIGEELRLSIKSVEKCLDKDELITIDKQSGFGNMRDFYNDLSEEMARAKRHDYDLMLMIVEVSYYEELKTIYNNEDIAKIIRTMSKIIKDSLRKEDKQFRIEEDRFCVIMPHTGVQGAEVVKGRIKEMLRTIVLSRTDSVEQLKFDIKIGLKDYNPDIKNQFHFKELAIKELEYDV